MGRRVRAGISGLEDHKFGLLIAVKHIGFVKDGKSNRATWECICECGSVINVIYKNLTSGNTTSCGKCNRSMPSGVACAKLVFCGYQKNAMIRNFEFNLTFEQFYSITQMNCSYCGKEPKQRRRHLRNNGDFVYNGIDRIDPKNGYIEGNCAPCCGICNRAKSDLSHDEFINMCRSVVKNYNPNPSIWPSVPSANGNSEPLR